MKINISRTGMFIPDWENNLSLPENEQIKIWYKRIVGEMASMMLVFNTDRTFRFNNAEIVKNCVTKIEGLIDEDGKKIESAEDLLLTQCTHGLVTMIGTHILNDSKLKEEIKKKLN